MSGVNSNHSENQALIAGRIDGTGTASVVAGKGFYLTDEGSGDYTITFNHGGYTKLISCVVTPEGATDCVASVGTVSIPAAASDGSIPPGATVQIRTRLYDGNMGSCGSADSDFSFCAIFEVADA